MTASGETASHPSAAAPQMAIAAPIKAALLPCLKNSRIMAGLPCAVLAQGLIFSAFCTAAFQETGWPHYLRVLPLTRSCLDIAGQNKAHTIRPQPELSRPPVFCLTSTDRSWPFPL